MVDVTLSLNNTQTDVFWRLVLEHSLQEINTFIICFYTWDILYVLVHPIVLIMHR